MLFKSKIRNLLKNEKNLLRFIGLGIILVSLPLAVILALRRQSLLTKAAPGNANVSIQPSSVTNNVGEASTVRVFIHPDGDGNGGKQAEQVVGIELYATFDPKIIQITRSGITPGNFFINCPEYPQPKVVRDAKDSELANGIIYYAIAYELGSGCFSDQTGYPVEIGYKALAAGSTNLNFVTSGFPKTTVINPTGADVTGNATNGQVVVIGGGANLSFSDPGSPTLNTNFSMDVYVNTDGQNADGVDAQILYDPTVLQAVSVNHDTADAKFKSFQGYTIDQTAGKIYMSANSGSLPPPPTPTPAPISGNGLKLGTIVFRATSVTTTQVKFEFTPGERNDSNIVLAGTSQSGDPQDILAFVVNSNITVQGVQPTATPTILPSPSPTTKPTATPTSVAPTSTPFPDGQSPFKGSPFTIPTAPGDKIEAEDFDNGGQNVAYKDNESLNLGGSTYRSGEWVDIVNNSAIGTSNNNHVGYAAPNEWLEYTVNIANSGNYQFTARVAHPTGGGKFRLQVDGQNVGSSITIPATGGWTSFQDVSTVLNLPSGVHVLKVLMESAATNEIYVANFDYYLVAQANITPTPTTQPTPTKTPPTPTATNTPSPAATPTSAPQTVTARLRFQGRTRAGADLPNNTTITSKNVLTGAQNTVTLAVQSNGEVLLSVTPGSYQFLIDAPGYLARRFGTPTNPIVVSVNQTILDLTNTTLLGGNLNNDNIINSFDYAVFVNNFLLGTNNIADLDGSNQVNNLDFSVLRSNWGLVDDQLL